VGQKVHPIGLRVGIIRDWESTCSVTSRSHRAFSVTRQRSGIGQRFLSATKRRKPVALGTNPPWAVVHAEYVVAVHVHFVQNRNAHGHLLFADNGFSSAFLTYTRMPQLCRPDVAIARRQGSGTFSHAKHSKPQGNL